MLQPGEETASPAARGLGLYIVAAIHGLEAIVLAFLIVGAWDEKMPGDSLMEASPWIALTVLLVAIAWGLWARKKWARVLSLLMHWLTLLGAVALLLLSLYVFFFVHETGIAIATALATVGLMILPPIVAVAGGVLWYLHKRWPRVEAEHV